MRPTSERPGVLPPAAILFDLDGTLIDGYGAIMASVNHVRAAHGLAPLDPATIRRSVGNGLHRLMETTVPLGRLEDNARLFLEHHPSVLASGTRLMPEVADTLAQLAMADIPLGVCSNKPISLTRAILDQQHIAGRFRVVLGPESVPRRKPAPDMLLAACGELKVSPSDTLYIGDMSIDIVTARAAGTRVWVLATGSHDVATLLAANPDRILERFSDIAESACPGPHPGIRQRA